jgi:hypothetical protein
MMASDVQRQSILLNVDLISSRVDAAVARHEHPPKLEAVDESRICGTVHVLPPADTRCTSQNAPLMRTFIVSIALACPMALSALGPSSELTAFFTQIGLTPQQITAIDQGRPVAKVLSRGGPSEVYVFGAVYIDGSPAAYLDASRNVTRLAGTEGYRGIGELPANASASNLMALTLEPDDIKALKSCREGDCDVQLPPESIQAFHDAVNWSGPDVATQVNRLAREMVVDLLREYRRGGNAALGTYRDKKNPARMAGQFETLVSRSSALPDVLPELRRYLLQYPDANLPSADSFFYWEKVDFGMKPTIRVNHGVIYRLEGKSVVAIKQLYASHYFHTALDLSVCVNDSTQPGRRGFYLLTLKGSEQEGLTGAKGSMLRKIVVDKTRSSLERALASIKRSIEQPTTAANK